jgi:hypothetical protein
MQTRRHVSTESRPSRHRPQRNTNRTANFRRCDVECGRRVRTDPQFSDQDVHCGLQRRGLFETPPLPAAPSPTGRQCGNHHRPGQHSGEGNDQRQRQADGHHAWEHRNVLPRKRNHLQCHKSRSRRWRQHQ